jgi:uncharacterized protein RhaS with RHS repeats
VVGNDTEDFTDIGEDKLISEISYATNLATYLVGLPSRTVLTDQTGKTVSESKQYYDQLAFGLITKGLLTKQESWKSGTSFATIQKTYDSVFGNVITETDPRGKITTYQYDVLNLYPVSVTNALGKITRYLYDYSLGKPKQITDQNGFVYKTIYDGFDRIMEEQQPDVLAPANLLTKILYSYTELSFGLQTKKTVFFDANNFVDSFTNSERLAPSTIKV